MNKKILATLVIAGSLFATGCSTMDNLGHKNDELTDAKVRNDLSKGMLLGAAVGAGTAASITTGAPIVYAALVGTGFFGFVGLENDLNNEEMRTALRERGVLVEDDYKKIVISLEEDVTFDLQKTFIKEEFKPTLSGIAMVLKELEDDTRVEVVGHADYTGPDKLNDYLSQERAEIVTEYLIGEGVNPEIFADYYGVESSQPKDYCLDLSCLRRVEIIIHKNDDLFHI